MAELEPGCARNEVAGRVEVDEAARICRQLFLEPRHVARLPGYENDNFRVDTGDGRFVLKVSPAAADRRRLEFEIDLLDHLESMGLDGAPRSVRSRRGDAIERLVLPRGEVDVRLLTWVDGRPLAELESRPRELLEQIGDYLARMDLALASSAVATADEPPAALWNLARPDTWPEPSTVEPAADRRRVEQALSDFTERVASDGAALGRGLIHADANDHNVLVSGVGDRPRIVGLIDFGDAGESLLLSELAVAAAYAGLVMEDPWDAVPPLVVGYSDRSPLAREELALLLPAVRARLALSLAMSASRRRRGTENPYVLISERPARRSLARLARLSAVEAFERLLDAVEGGADG